MTDSTRAITRYDGPRTIDELERYGLALAVNRLPDGSASRNDALPAIFRGNPAAVVFVTEYAKALDVSPITAMLGIHMIDGKPSASAGLISALVRRAGHKIRTWTEGTVEGGDLKAITTIVREDDPEFTYRSEWSLARAVRAGLCTTHQDPNTGTWTVTARGRSGKPGGWETYTESLAKARSITECSRDAAEDAILGVHYTPEELGVDTDEAGEPVYTVTQVPHVNGDNSAHTAPAAAPAAPAPAPAPAAAPDPDELAEEARVAILDARTLEELGAVWNGPIVQAKSAIAAVLVCGDENAVETTVLDLFTRAADAIKAGTHLTADAAPEPDPETEEPDDVHDAHVVEDEPVTPAEIGRAQLDAVMSQLSPDQIQTVVGYCRDHQLNPANGDADCLAIVKAITTGEAWGVSDPADPEALVRDVLGGVVVDRLKVTDTATIHARDLAEKRHAAAQENRDDAAAARPAGGRPAPGTGREAFEAARSGRTDA